MREIKFRAWDRELNKMVYNFEEIVDADSYCPEYHVTLEPVFKVGAEDHNGDWYEVTLMQYTGLKDKNGKEIYEGDIAKDHIGNIGIIKFGHPFCNGFYVRCILDSNGQTIDITEPPVVGWYAMTLNSEKELEIIGNIHENPELLK